MDTNRHGSIAADKAKTTMAQVDSAVVAVEELAKLLAEEDEFDDCQKLLTARAAMIHTREELHDALEGYL